MAETREAGFESFIGLGVLVRQFAEGPVIDVRRTQKFAVLGIELIE